MAGLDALEVGGYTPFNGHGALLYTRTPMLAEAEPGWRCCRWYVRCMKPLVVDPGRPRIARWVSLWDTVLAVVLMTTAVVTPYNLVFFRPRDAPREAFLLDRCIDIFFAMNMGLQCVLAYPDPLRPALYVKEPDAILAKYLSGWFFPDVLTLIPVYALRSKLPNEAGEHIRNSIRLLQVFRILRLMHLHEVCQRWTTSFGLSFAKLALLQFLGTVFVICHWIACVWAATALYLHERGRPNWLDALRVAKGDDVDLHLQATRVYTLSLYWAVVTLTSIGYGDIAPQCHFEYLVACASMAILSSSWAYVVGSVCSILSTLQPHEMTFQSTMDDLNQMLHDRQMPEQMCQRIRRYFIEARETNKLRVEEAIVAQMSPKLQGECAMFLHHQWIKRIWYLQRLPPEAVTGVARRLRLSLYTPSEEIWARRTLCIVRKGIGTYRGRTLLQGDAWGHDLLLLNDNLRERGNARALTYLSVLRLHVNDLYDVVLSMPWAKGHLRFAQMRTALFRGMRLLAGAITDLKRHHSVDVPMLDEEMRVRLFQRVLSGELPSPLRNVSPEDLRVHMQVLEGAAQEVARANDSLTASRQHATTSEAGASPRGRGEPKRMFNFFPPKKVLPGRAQGGARGDLHTQGGARGDLHAQLDVEIDARVDARVDARIDVQLDARVDARVDARMDELKDFIRQCIMEAADNTRLKAS